MFALLRDQLRVTRRQTTLRAHDKARPVLAWALLPASLPLPLPLRRNLAISWAIIGAHALQHNFFWGSLDRISLAAATARATHYLQAHSIAFEPESTWVLIPGFECVFVCVACNYTYNAQQRASKIYPSKSAKQQTRTNTQTVYELSSDFLGEPEKWFQF